MGDEEDGNGVAVGVTTPSGAARHLTGVYRPGLAENSPLDCFPGAEALLKGKARVRGRRPLHSLPKGGGRISASEKQRKFWREANHRWNIKTGATRSGKTYMDYFLIPRRLRAVSGREGLNVILGNTRETVRRNILLPMQGIYGARRVSDIHSDNSATMFGERVFVLGADRVSHVDRLRGASIKYCYGDEIVTWHRDVFEISGTARRGNSWRRRCG